MSGVHSGCSPGPDASHPDTRLAYLRTDCKGTHSCNKLHTNIALSVQKGTVMSEYVSYKIKDEIMYNTHLTEYNVL